jgi:hypothetical protein
MHTILVLSLRIGIAAVLFLLISGGAVLVMGGLIWVIREHRGWKRFCAAIGLALFWLGCVLGAFTPAVAFVKYAAMEWLPWWWALIVE